MDAHEIQALLRHHAASIVEAIDDGGLRPSQYPKLVLTVKRMAELVNDLEMAIPSDTKGDVD